MSTRFEYYGGRPRSWCRDNLRSAVTKAHRYEPDMNATYQEMAAHYSMAVIPARPYKPRDKAKVEAGVLLAERWIIARLRHRRFYSLAEANARDRRVRRGHQRQALQEDGRAREPSCSRRSTVPPFGRYPPSATSSPPGRR